MNLMGEWRKEIIKVSRNIMFEYTKLFMIPQLELTVIVSIAHRRISLRAAEWEKRIEFSINSLTDS